MFCRGDLRIIYTIFTDFRSLMARWLRGQRLRDMKCTVYDLEVMVHILVRSNLRCIVILSMSYLNQN